MRRFDEKYFHQEIEKCSHASLLLSSTNLNTTKNDQHDSAGEIKASQKQNACRCKTMAWNQLDER